MKSLLPGAAFATALTIAAPVWAQAYYNPYPYPYAYPYYSYSYPYYGYPYPYYRSVPPYWGWGWFWLARRLAWRTPPLAKLVGDCCLKLTSWLDRNRPDRGDNLVAYGSSLGNSHSFDIALSRRG